MKSFIQIEPAQVSRRRIHCSWNHCRGIAIDKFLLTVCLSSCHVMPFRPARCRSQITLPPTNGCIATLVGMRGLAVGRVVAPSLTPDRLCPVGEYGNKTLYFWLHEANKPHNKIKKHSGISALSACFCYWIFWRRGPESNRPTRICNPVHNRFATAP